MSKRTVYSRVESVDTVAQMKNEEFLYTLDKDGLIISIISVKDLKACPMGITITLLKNNPIYKKV